MIAITGLHWRARTERQAVGRVRVYRAVGDDGREYKLQMSLEYKLPRPVTVTCGGVVIGHCRTWDSAKNFCRKHVNAWRRGTGVLHHGDTERGRR